MRTVRWVLLGVFAACVGVTLFLQRETTANLRNEVALLREDQRELAALRAERQRLLAAQPAAAELERLRGDHAALAKLRGKIEKLQERTTQREASVTTSAKAPPPTLALGVGREGALSFDGKSVELAALRQRLSEFARGSTVEIHFTLPPRATTDDMKAAVDQLIGLEKELGLKLNFRWSEPRAPGAP